RGNQVLYAGVRAAEHDVLPGAFEIIVDDFERARSIPTANGLRIGADLVDFGDIGIDDSGRSAIDVNPASRVFSGVTMNITAVDDQVIRNLREGALIRAEVHDFINIRAAFDPNFQPEETEMMRARSGADRRVRIWAQDLWHHRGIGRRN